MKEKYTKTIKRKIITPKEEKKMNKLQWEPDLTSFKGPGYFGR